MLSHRTSGGDPEGMAELALRLDQAGEELLARAVAIEADLDQVGEASRVPAQLRGMADWCSRWARQVREAADALVLADLRARRDAARAELAGLAVEAYVGAPVRREARRGDGPRREALAQAVADLTRLIRRLDALERGELGPPFYEDPEGWGSALSGAVLGEFDDNGSWSAIGAATAVGLVPYVGQAADVRDILATGWHRRWSRLPVVLLAVVPGLDFLKRGSRAGRKLLAELWSEGLPKVADEGMAVLATKIGPEAAARLTREVLVLKLARAELIVRLKALLVEPDLPQSVRADLGKATNALRDHLKPEDLVGALRDRNGVPVAAAVKESYDHLYEVNVARKSLANAKTTMWNALPPPGESKNWKRLPRRITREMEALAEVEARMRHILGPFESGR